MNTKKYKPKTLKSVSYFIKDVFFIVLCMGGIKHLIEMEIYQNMNRLSQYLCLLPLQFVTGFFMWCLFVIGHDCGHGTFSTSSVVKSLAASAIGSNQILSDNSL